MEETPVRSRIQFGQGTPLPESPLDQFSPGTPNGQPRQQLPHTPLKMFEQTPPSTQDEARASRGQKQPSFRSSPAAIKLPAVPTRPLYSYGTVGQVSMPTMDIRNSTFGGYDTQRALLQLSAESHKRRQKGMHNSPPNSASATGTAAQSPPAVTTQAQPQVQPQAGRKRTPKPPTSKPPEVPIEIDFTEDAPPPPMKPQKQTQGTTRARQPRRPQEPATDRTGSMSVVIAWNRVRNNDYLRYAVIRGRYYVILIGKLLLLVVGALGVLGVIFLILSGLINLLSPTFLRLIGRNGGSQTDGGAPSRTGDSQYDKGSWIRRTAGYFTAPPNDPSDAQEVIQRLRAVELGVERIDKERVDIAKIEREYENLSRTFDKNREDYSGRFTEINDFMAKLDTNIQRTREDINTLMRFKEQTNEAFKKLHRDLPEMMPIRRDSNGKLSIPPEFFQELKEYLKREFPRGLGDGNAGGEKTIIVEKPAKWTDFMGRNKEPFDSYVNNLQQKWWDRTKREEKLVSKAEFMELLKKELDDVHNELHNQASSLTSLKDMLAKGAFEKGKSGSGELLPNEPYHYPGFKLVDYASHAGGGFIDPSRTSPTHEYHPPNKVLRFFHELAGSNARIPRPRTVISSMRPEPGNCWPFPGKVGNLGLILREPIHVSGMTLEHIDWEQSVVKTATPKSINLWVRVAEPMKYYDQTVKAAAKALSMAVEDVQAPKGIPLMYEYVKVGAWEFKYDETSLPVQTWSIPLNLKAMNVSSDRVVISILDNYGHETYTCLYRVRVHGEPAKKQGGSGTGTPSDNDTRQPQSSIPVGGGGDWLESTMSMRHD